MGNTGKEKEMEAARLANVGDRWRKMSFIVWRTMLEMGTERPRWLNNTYFALRLEGLIEAGRWSVTGMRER